MTTPTRRPQKKRWSDLSAGQQRAAIVAGIVQVGLLVAAQLDLGRRTAEQVRGPKAMWRLLTLVNIVGPLAYFAVGRRR